MLATEYEKKYPVALRLNLKVLYLFTFIFLIVNTGLFISSRFDIALKINDDIESSSKNIRDVLSQNESRILENFYNNLKNQIGIISFGTYNLNQEQGFAEIRVNKREIFNGICYNLLITMNKDSTKEIIIPFIFKKFKSNSFASNFHFIETFPNSYSIFTFASDFNQSHSPIKKIKYLFNKKCYVKENNDFKSSLFTPLISITSFNFLDVEVNYNYNKSMELIFSKNGLIINFVDWDENKKLPLSIFTNNINSLNSALLKNQRRPVFYFFAIISSVFAFSSFLITTFILIKVQSSRGASKYYSSFYVFLSLLWNAMINYSNILICINAVNTKFNLVFYPGLIIFNLISLVEFRILISILFYINRYKISKIYLELQIFFLFYCFTIYFSPFLLKKMIYNQSTLMLFSSLMIISQIFHNMTLPKKSKFHIVYSLMNTLNFIFVPIFCSHPFVENLHSSIYNDQITYGLFIIFLGFLNLILYIQTKISPYIYIPQYFYSLLRDQKNYKIIKKNEIQSEFICSICLNESSIDIIISTVCLHKFHYSCLKGWFDFGRNKKLCPMCKKDLPKLK